jgi:hypothetical protein
MPDRRGRLAARFGQDQKSIERPADNDEGNEG